MKRIVGQRFILHPGFVRSKTDGQQHFISASKLAELYRVDLRDCIVLAPDNPEKGFGFEWKEDDVDLYPRTDGNYNLSMPNASGEGREV